MVLTCRLCLQECKYSLKNGKTACFFPPRRSLGNSGLPSCIWHRKCSLILCWLGMLLVVTFCLRNSLMSFISSSHNVLGLRLLLTFHWNHKLRTINNKFLLTFSKGQGWGSPDSWIDFHTWISFHWSTSSESLSSVLFLPLSSALNL